MQGCGSTKAENGLNTTISEFTSELMNIEMVVGDNKFSQYAKHLYHYTSK